MRFAFFVGLVCFLSMAGCERKADVRKSGAPVGSDSEFSGKDSVESEESALQEYVNEPKRRAKDVRSNLESAQERAADQAAALSDDEGDGPSADSEDE